MNKFKDLVNSMGNVLENRVVIPWSAFSINWGIRDGGEYTLRPGAFKIEMQVRVYNTSQLPLNGQFQDVPFEESHMILDATLSQLNGIASLNLSSINEIDANAKGAELRGGYYHQLLLVIVEEFKLFCSLRKEIHYVEFIVLDKHIIKCLNGIHIGDRIVDSVWRVASIKPNTLSIACTDIDSKGVVIARPSSQFGAMLLTLIGVNVGFTAVGSEDKLVGKRPLEMSPFQIVDWNNLVELDIIGFTDWLLIKGSWKDLRAFILARDLHLCVAELLALIACRSFSSYFLCNDRSI